jgi:hypothetical protein
MERPRRLPGKELGAKGMLADTPEAGLVTVVLPHELIDAGDECADNSELGNVRAKPDQNP